VRPFKTRFSIQVHYGRRPGPGLHWDLRVVIPPNGVVWSWAIPKMRFPEKGERVLAVWVDDKHTLKDMTHQGRWPGGDKVELYDYGYVHFLTQSKFRLVLDFYGKNIKGVYHMIKIDPNWLILKSS